MSFSLSITAAVKSGLEGCCFLLAFWELEDEAMSVAVEVVLFSVIAECYLAMVMQGLRLVAALVQEGPLAISDTELTELAN